MTTSNSASAKWADSEFGHTKLGNSARTTRLVALAAAVADRPGGKVTEVIERSAEREGAYRLLENDKVTPDALMTSVARATARRCRGEEYVYVPLDGSSLTLKDPRRIRGLGCVGRYNKKAQGLEMMNAIAVRRDGTSLGLLDQVYWVRTRQPGRKKTRKKRRIHEKETRYWLEAAEHVREALVENGAGALPWFQMDRGGDFREALFWASETDAIVTVRAAQNRRVKDEEARYLWERIERTSPLGSYTLNVTARAGRKARIAQMEVRARRVTLVLRDTWRKTKPREITLTAVLAKEIGTTPVDEKPLQWLLLTNREVTNFAQAWEVLFAYTQRWRIEEFHRTWKSTCRIEETQLRSVQAIETWAIILAAVAMRIERLKQLSRQSPEEPATIELSKAEIEAVIVLRNPQGYRRGDIPPIGEVVRWIAELGGYTGRSSGGPPGAVTLGRGLKRVEPVVIALRNLKEN